MLFAVIGTSGGKTRDEIMTIYPRHKVFLDQFVARGEVVGVGPFTDPPTSFVALNNLREPLPVSLFRHIGEHRCPTPTAMASAHIMSWRAPERRWYSSTASPLDLNLSAELGDNLQPISSRPSQCDRPRPFALAEIAI